MSQLSLFDVEQWRDIPGYEGIYQASTHGNVRRFRSLKRGSTTRILKPSQYGDGYSVVSLSVNGVPKGYLLHRLIALTFLGECPSGMEVNHIDTDKWNNHLGNLEYITHAENMSHAAENRLGNFLYSHNDKQQIRASYIPRVVTLQALAERFGGTPQAIANVLKNGKRPIPSQESSI